MLSADRVVAIVVMVVAALQPCYARIMIDPANRVELVARWYRMMGLGLGLGFFPRNLALIVLVHRLWEQKHKAAQDEAEALKLETEKVSGLESASTELQSKVSKACPCGYRNCDEGSTSSTVVCPRAVVTSPVLRGSHSVLRNMPFIEA